MASMMRAIELSSIDWAFASSQVEGVRGRCRGVARQRTDVAQVNTDMRFKPMFMLNVE